MFVFDQQESQGVSHVGDAWEGPGRGPGVGVGGGPGGHLGRLRRDRRVRTDAARGPARGSGRGRRGAPPRPHVRGLLTPASDRAMLTSAVLQTRAPAVGRRPSRPRAERVAEPMGVQVADAAAAARGARPAAGASAAGLELEQPGGPLRPGPAGLGDARALGKEWREA